MKRTTERKRLETEQETPKMKYKKMNSVNPVPIVSKDGKTVSGNQLNPPKSKPYRLIIQIDKIYLKPCPKSKKINQIKMRIENLQKSRDSSKTEAPQEYNETSKEEQKNSYQCLVCKETFVTISELYTHVKKHFICDICKTEFTSRNSYKKHYALHQSNLMQLPYKCHICKVLFETKDLLRRHSHIILDKYNDAEQNRVQYCKTCNMTFKYETTFRAHLDSHVEKEAILQRDESLVTANHKILPKGTVIETLTPVVFSCRICSKNFTSITDIDKHTKSHLEQLESKSEN